MIISESLDNYLTTHTSDAPELLNELERETFQKVLQPIMLSGHYQGRLLSMISKLIGPKSVLELGTYTGYATLCLAEGLLKHGEIHTIDINEELVDFQRKYFQKSPWNNQIFQYTGNALDILPQLKLSFDLVFIDADKANYPKYVNPIIDKLNPGGVIISDNVLWHGKVLNPEQNQDESTRAMLQFNQLLKEDKRIETIILPIRDGLTLSRKK